MANLKSNFLGFEVKNPIGVSSCDFGGEVDKAKRVIDQGIGWLTGKTLHKIDGPHRWPRPYFYSLKKFGNGLQDSWICSQMFHNCVYEEYLEKEGPATLKLCRENGVLFIQSVCGIGEEPEEWIPFLKDAVTMGCDMIELDTGGPHATFGAIAEHADVGAPLAMDPEKAYRITKACVEAVKVPIIYKMTPQCVNQAAVTLAVQRAGGHAFTANNSLYGTWIDHENGTFYGGPYAVGGLMGRPWQMFSLAKFLESSATAKGMAGIGVGGVFYWDDVVRYMMAGANLVGFCSSLYTRGVGVLKDAIDGLGAFMDRKGYKSTNDFLGRVVEDFSYVRDWPREKIMAKESPILPMFDQDKCTHCGSCEKVCPYGAISNSKEAPKYDDKICMGCGWCMGHCPAEGCIKMVKRGTDHVVWNGHGTHEAWCKE